MSFLANTVLFSTIDIPIFKSWAKTNHSIAVMVAYSEKCSFYPNSNYFCDDIILWMINYLFPKHFIPLLALAATNEKQQFNFLRGCAAS